MRFFRNLVGAMTGLCIAGTVQQVAFGDNVGLMIFGLGVSIAGIFTVALTGDTYER